MCIGSLRGGSPVTGALHLTSGQLQWGSPGPCPSCGAITDHAWFPDVRPGVWPDERAHGMVTPPLIGSQGQLMVSRCVSQSCQALAVWIRTVVMEKGFPEEVTYLAYPQAGVRIPPAGGLQDEEVRLYAEAARSAPVSPRGSVCVGACPVGSTLEALSR